MGKVKLFDAEGFWLNANMWLMVMFSVLGLLGRTLISKEPFDKHRFAGEVLLTIIGTVGVWASGLLHGFDTLEMIAYGCLMCLGGIHAGQWIAKAVMAVKAGS